MRSQDIIQGKQYETRRHGIVTVIDCARSASRPVSKLFRVDTTTYGVRHLSQREFLREAKSK